MTSTFVDVPPQILQNRHDKVIRESPNLISILPYKPISVSNNTIGFVFQTPSFNTLMSEKVLLSFRGIKMNFAFAGAVGANNVDFAVLGGLALRSFPVERLVQTAQIVLGSTSVSFPISDIMEATAFASYDMNEFASTAASFERPVEEVGCAMGAVIGAGPGGVANLLCAQTSSSTNSFILSGVPGAVPKGGSLNIEGVALQTANTAVFNNGQFQSGQTLTTANPVQVQMSMSGYLKLPILQWLAAEAKESLSSLSQIQINLILNPAQTIVNYLEPQFVTGTTVPTSGGLALQSINFDSQSFVSANITLSIKYITPPANYSMKDVVRAYYQIDRYITTYQGTIAPQTTISSVVSNVQQISSNSFTLPAVPRYLMLFVKPSRNYYYSNINSVQVSNFYLPIVNVSLTLANRTAQLSTAPIEHLYSLAVESGLKSKWSQYRGYGSILPSNNTITANVFGTPGANGDAVAGLGAGSPAVGNVDLTYEPYAGAPLLLDLSTCLGLSEELCIGRNVPISLQATVTIVNPSGLQVNQVEFFVLSVTPAYLSIDHMNGNSVVTLGGVSAEEAMQVASMNLGEIDNHHQTKFAGGFSFSDIVSKVKGILPGVKNVAKAVSSGLESMGYGTTGAGMMGSGAQEKKMAAVMKKMKAMAM